MMFRVVATLTVCAITLAGCEQPQPIISGKREAVDTLIQDAPARAEIINKSVAFRAPSMSSNENWTQGHGTQRTRTSHPTLGSAPQLIWSAPIGVGDGKRTRITADPLVADGRIFAVDAEARLSAHATTGAALWSVDLTPQGEGKGEAAGAGLAYGDGTLFVTTSMGFCMRLTQSMARSAGLNPCAVPETRARRIMMDWSMSLARIVQHGRSRRTLAACVGKLTVWMMSTTVWDQLHLRYRINSPYLASARARCRPYSARAVWCIGTHP